MTTNRVKIERRPGVGAGLDPAVLETLVALADQATHHSEYGLRPPVGIYNLSLHQLWKRFSPVLDALDKVVSQRSFLSGDGTWHEELLASHESLLYSLMEHIEDCQSILRCFFRKADKKARDKHVRKFTEKIEDYRDYVATIVNGIKHNQLRLHSIIHYSDQVVVPGYFVLGPDKEGVLGPAPSVHSPGDEAFSFNWDLRYHFAHTYVISHHLMDAICTIHDCKEQPAEALPASTDTTILSIASRISELPNWVFVNEIGQPYAKVTVRTVLPETVMTIEFPAREKDLLILNQARVNCMVLGDGVSKAFRFPALR